VQIVQPTDLVKYPVPPDISVDHAGMMETREALYLSPELVQMENSGLPGGQVGVGPGASGATAEMGQMVVQMQVGFVVKLVQEE